MNQEQLKALTTQHKVPDELKLKYRAQQLENMRKFYLEKIPTAPEKLGWVFTGYVGALDYALSILDAYQKLTAELQKLNAKEVKNEARTNSPDGQ